MRLVGENLDSEKPGRAARPSVEDALLEVEVRRLIHAIAPYGVLRQDALARACHAGQWQSGQFEKALDAAVREGRLRRLGCGFYGKRAPQAVTR